MEYSEFIEKIYEADSLVITYDDMNVSFQNIQGEVGRAEEFEKGIEIMLENDFTVYLNKENINKITEDNCAICISFNNSLAFLKIEY